MKLIGRVLWWSDRDENGIIVDPIGNEYFFDRSVISLGARQKIKSRSVVTFEINTKISECLCAHKVRMPFASRKTSYERQFERQVNKSQLEAEAS